MSDEKYNSNLMVGAAVVAGILGTLSALMRPNRNLQGWTEQVKDAASHMMDKEEMVNKNMLMGGVAGGLIGAATALLLAPKAGSDFIKDLAHPFASEEKHARSTSRKSGSSRSTSRKSASRKKGASRSTKSHGAQEHKEVTRTGESHRSKSATAKKRSPARRRTAAAALKQASTATEKAVNDVTATS